MEEPSSYFSVSLALSEWVAPLAVVLNCTGQWIAKNGSIIALKEECAPKYEKGSTLESKEK